MKETRHPEILRRKCATSIIVERVHTLMPLCGAPIRFRGAFVRVFMSLLSVGFHGAVVRLGGGERALFTCFHVGFWSAFSWGSHDDSFMEEVVDEISRRSRGVLVGSHGDFMRAFS